MIEINEIVDTLESTGVYDTANLIDPVSITKVALSLANTATPNEYIEMLGLWAAVHQVSTTDLAVDVLAVLARAGQFVGPIIATSAAAQHRAVRREVVAV
jgi:hypothetical protein